MLDNPIEVMLAEKMDKPMEFYSGWRIQEKSDGIRALIVKENGILQVFGRNKTKKGRAVFTPSVPEIADFFADVDNFVIDCELMSKDFLQLQTKVRTTKTVVHDPYFYIKAFDLVKWDDFDAIKMGISHDDRYQSLQDFISQFGEQRFFRAIVQAPLPFTEEYMQQCMDKILAKGGEGLILKNPAGLYVPGKRRRDWTKVLPYREMDVVFVAAVQGEGKYLGTLGALTAYGLTSEGQINEAILFNVGTGWDDATRNQIWEKALVQGFFPIPGKVKMKDIYPGGIPRMPVFHSFNVDKGVD